jgi:DNA-binding beta-propeller fold protein YncE
MEIKKMFVVRFKPRAGKWFAVALLLSLAIGVPYMAYGKNKKEAAVAPAPPPAQEKPNNFSSLVWPAPPDPVRIRYVDYVAGEKIDRTPVVEKKKKQGWMDRMAGTPEGVEKQQKLLKNFPYQMIWPSGVAVDSKGFVYVADTKVGAIFIINPETKDVQLIENGRDAHFGWMNGVAIDDNDRLFVSDGKLDTVMVFNAQHKLEGQFKEGMVDPNGLAIDTENRLLYVVDTQQDQVLVYDADTYKLLRRIGTTGKKHTLTTPGDFAGPTNAAVDSDGNLYVTDTMNDRVEIFDAAGNFINSIGKNCDAPGCFERPKGIAVDGDGHIWVADAMMDKLQILNNKGQVLMVVGGHGNLPSQFSVMHALGYDKVRHRIYTTEVYPGRMQEFQYITDAEAAAEAEKAAAERQAKFGKSGVSSSFIPAVQQPDTSKAPPAGAADKSAPPPPAK